MHICQSNKTFCRDAYLSKAIKTLTVDEYRKKVYDSNYHINSRQAISGAEELLPLKERKKL